MMKKQKKKKRVNWGIFVAILVIILVAVTNGSDNENQNANINEGEQNGIEPSALVSATEASTMVPTATSRPANQESWVRAILSQEYDDDLISVEWSDVDQGTMINIYCVFADNLTNELRRTMFLSHARDVLEKLTQLRTSETVDFDLVFIHGRTTFVDNYGREFEGDAMQLCVSAKDLEKVIWENMHYDMLQGIATTYAVHPLFRD